MISAALLCSFYDFFSTLKKFMFFPHTIQGIQSRYDQNKKNFKHDTHHHIQQQQSNDFTSMRSPSSAASSGLGLSLEEDFSLKYCQSVIN